MVIAIPYCRTDIFPLCFHLLNQWAVGLFFGLLHCFCISLTLILCTLLESCLFTGRFRIIYSLLCTLYLRINFPCFFYLLLIPLRGNCLPLLPNFGAKLFS